MYVPPSASGSPAPSSPQAPTRRSTTSAPQGLRLSRAEIRGKLTITDPATFVGVLTRGLGHGRAYGCGLVLVR
ncbi:type I-E CRISPR-associated protein Cas6/Cse3/CasE [Streptomyces sp. NPDC020875]|uniref:type I-E CRISPR-associated protein Cas6/Cse3/CasE n=1 Tax=Streptomyces sp. NPDC020875 TaxID=3154898 RepID=UPI0033F70B1E